MNKQKTDARQLLALVDTLGLPTAQGNAIKNAIAQAHIINSVAFHFVEHNQHGLLSPLTRLGATVNLDYLNLAGHAS